MSVAANKDVAPKRWRARVIAVLLFAFVAGLAVRVVGIRHGEPYLVFHPDVAKQTRVARHVFHGHNDIRGVFEDDMERVLYPYGMSALLGRGWRAYASLSGDRDVDEVHRWTWALRMRHLSVALFMTATLLAMLLVSRKWTVPIALAVGLLLWLEPVNVQMSHYGMNDVPLAGLLLLAWALSTRMPGEPLRFPWASLTCGLVLGSAVGVKYQALLGLAFPGVAWLTALRERGWPWAVVSAVTLALAWLAGVFLSCPLLTAEPGYFLTQFPEFMAWQSNIMGEDLAMTAKASRNLGAVLELFTQPGYLAFLVLAVVGCLAVFLYGEERHARPFALSAALFCVVLTLGILFGRDFVRANDFIPVFVFLAVAVVPALRWAGSMGRWPAGAAATLAGLAILWFTLGSVRDSAALARVDTRVRAQQWCREYLAADTMVLRERYTLGIGRDDVTERESRNLASRDARRRIERGRFDYLITSSLAHDRFGDTRSAYHDPERVAFYQTLEETLQPLARFEDRPLLFAHPTVTVYTNSPPNP